MSISGSDAFSGSGPLSSGLRRNQRLPQARSLIRRAVTAALSGDLVEHLESRVFLSASDPIPPTANLTSAPPTSPFGSDYFFSVRYKDNVAIDATTIGNDDIEVDGPGGLRQLATFISTSMLSDGSIIANYTITAPPTTGAFTIQMLSNTVFDTGQNAVNPGPLGTFIVDFEGPINEEFPVAVITAAPVRVLNNTTYNFEVTYNADNKIHFDSIFDGHDILISGSNGFSVIANPLIPIPRPIDGPTITIAYQFAAPTKSGVYNVFFLPQDKPNSIDWPGDLDPPNPGPQLPAPLQLLDDAQGVFDYANHYIPFGQIGQFTLVPANSFPNNQTAPGLTPRVNPRGPVDLMTTFQAAIPTKAAVGGTTTIPVRISNVGGTAAANVGVSLFASGDQTIDSSDTFLTQVFLKKLKAGKSKVVNIKFNFGDLTPGTYFLVSKADKDGLVTESNEANNDSFSQNTILVQTPFVDLTAALTGDLPDSVLGGTPGSTTLHIGNSGNVIFNRPVDVTLYASTDTVLDAGDPVVANGSFPEKIAISDFRDVKLKFNYPTTLSDGAYHLIAKIDGGPTIGDPNAANNIAASAQTVNIVKPFIDLTPTSALIANAGGQVALASGSNTVSVLVRNLGNIPVGGSLSISVSVVPLAATTTSIPLVTQTFNTTIKLDTIQRYTLSFVLPDSLASGSYFLKATVDPDNRFVESNELNNDVFSIAPIQVIQTG